MAPPRTCSSLPRAATAAPVRAAPRSCGPHIERSLQSLRTEAIGLYYPHRMDPETPLKESLSAIKAYVDRGAIRHVGVSGACSRSSRPAGSFRSAPCRTATAWPTAGTTTVVDFWEREGIAFVPYYPLSGDDAPRVAAAAKRLGVTGTMVKLAWVLGARPSSFPSRERSRSSTCARTSRALELQLEDPDDIAA
jgi:pyridoxine 4-dehydrogenase